MNTPVATVLVVDDENRNRRLLELLLRPEGYVVRHSASGEEAVDDVARQPPDLILLDIMMPGMDGYQVAGILKASPASADIPIIMVTALADRAARMRGLEAGVDEFLSKPVDRGELCVRVRNMLRIKALGDQLKSHAVTLERKVQERTLDLSASEARFRQMAEAISQVFYLHEADSGRMLYVSPAYERIFGRSCESLYARPGSWSEAIHPEDRVSVERDSGLGMQAGGYTLEYRIVRPDGEIRWIEAKGFTVNDPAAKVARTAGIAVDITTRKYDEIAIMRLNRINAVLGGINALIVRTRGRDELFKEACRIAVETGGLYMSLIATVDPAGESITPAASMSRNLALQGEIEDILTSPEYAPKTIVARAIRDKELIVSNDSGSDSRVLFGARCVTHGVRSIAVLPLIVADEAVGALTLFSREAGFFDQAEMKLLNELAGDISFAIDYIGKQDRLRYLAYYDELTGLANRTLLLERMVQHVRSAAAGNHELAVFLIDLERFKNLNDSLGQSAGDELLRQVAEWLTGSVGDASLVARLGADQFAVVLPRVKPDGNVARFLEQTMAALLDHAFQLKGSVFRIAAKVGAARYPQDGTDPDGLVKNAEAALKGAKAGGDRYLFFTPKMTEAVSGKLALENQLRQAIDRQEFVLHYQPKSNLASGEIASAEALIRWNDPGSGLVPPGRFIPVLEEIGLIYEVGRWALHKAIEDYLRWRKEGLPAVRIAVNVSPLQLRSRDFISDIEQAVAVDEHAAAGLELEITESLIMADVEHSIATLQAIRAMGVTVAIDDFGTGYSSLNYLSKLPVDTLKIDRTFITEMTTSNDGLSLVSTIIELAHSLRLNVVAEGVESEEQRRLLCLLKCDEMQGYLFSRPLPADSFEARFLATAARPTGEGVAPRTAGFH